MLRMELHGVNLDVITNQPVIILRDTTSSRFLPIWIGQFEAQSILMETQGIKPSRPLTHDLMCSIIERFSARVEHILISDLKNGTFFAIIHLQLPSSTIDVDARPSDAIAIAVRTHSPIFASETVLEEASITPGDQQNEEEEVKRFKNFLEKINPEDFKK
jgi:hypothetical protein